MNYNSVITIKDDEISGGMDFQQVADLVMGKMESASNIFLKDTISSIMERRKVLTKKNLKISMKAITAVKPRLNIFQILDARGEKK